MNQCYECKFRRNVPGDTHSACAAPLDKIKVVADAHGIRNGWFLFPYNFDPVWLEECNSFTPKSSS